MCFPGLCQTDLCKIPFSGMKTKSFRGMSSIQEVECSGEALPGDTKLFSMVLYNILDRRNVAYVNRLDGECYTSLLYSACFMDTSDSRKTRLVTLVTGYRDGAPLVFGCNMSTFRMGVAELVSWFLPVKLIGRSLLSSTGLFSLNNSLNNWLFPFKSSSHIFI